MIYLCTKKDGPVKTALSFNDFLYKKRAVFTAL